MLLIAQNNGAGTAFAAAVRTAMDGSGTAQKPVLLAKLAVKELTRRSIP